MDISEYMREIEQYWLGQAQESFAEGAFEIMQFVKIGERIVNLERVTFLVPEMQNTGRPCITIFFGGDDYLRVYKRDIDGENNPAFAQLTDWMESCPVLDLSFH